MATIIDSLFVELGIDTKKFTAAQRQAVDEFKKSKRQFRDEAKETEEVGRRNSETLAQAGRKVLGFVAAFAGLREIKRFVDELTKADAATGRMANNIETSTKDLQAWQGAIQRVGGSSQAAAQTMLSLSQQFHKFSITGEGGDFIKWMQALGVTPADPNTGKLKEFNQLLLETSEAMQKLSPAQRVTFGQGFGLDEGFINLLGLGPQKVRELLERQNALGAATDEQIRKANDLQQAWLDLGQAVYSFGRDIAEGFLEPITKGLQEITHFFSWWRSQKGQKQADEQGRTLHQNLRNRFGTPSDIDRMLFGDKITDSGGGLFGPLSRLLQGQGGAAPAGDAVQGTQATIRLRAKPGAGIENTHAGTQALASSIQRDIPGLNRFTAGNDSYHRGQGAHGRGLALDFTVNDPSQAPAVAAQLRAKLAAMGIRGTVLDEYSRPSPFSTGGHIHVQFASEADAARFQGAQDANRSTAAATAAGAPGGGGAVSGNTRSVAIGTLNVNTQATDADGIARGIGAAIERNVASEANYGQVD